MRTVIEVFAPRNVLINFIQQGLAHIFIKSVKSILMNAKNY